MKNFYSPLKSRAILAVSGKDVTAFLQGICTQEIEKLPQNTLSYAVHLNPQGRFLYDFFILKQNNKILLECAKNELMDLATSLHKYAINFKINFEDMTDDYDIFAQWNSNSNEGLPDPRHTQLGNRIYLAKNKTPQNGEEKIESDYEEHRISLCIPDGSKDAIKNKTFTAELGLEFLNGVSFDKGCYVGQELVARLHFRTETKKRLYKITSPKQISVNSSIMFNEQEVATITSAYKHTGLAIINNRHINKELTCDKQDITITAPSWFSNNNT